MYREEKAIEQYLVRQVKSAKGMALKVTSPYTRFSNKA